MQFQHRGDDLVGGVVLGGDTREVTQIPLALLDDVARVRAPTRLWPATTVFRSRAVMEPMLAIHASRAVASVRAVNMCTWL